MKSNLFYSLMFAAVVAPVSLQAQTPTPQSRIDVAMQTAAKAHIPVALLESKVAEGQAKQVPQERIAAAVEARLQALVRASDAMKRAEVNAASQSDLAVSADALEAGVSESALIKISRTAPAERRAVAVATLSGLVQLGHASDRALERVSAVVRSNAALANLHAEVASQLHAGGPGNANVNAGGLIRIK